MNEKMWTELFLDNPKHLSNEIELLIQHLEEYADAIRTGNREKLYELLTEGRERKAVIDGEMVEEK